MIYSVWTGVEQKGYYADTYIYSISLLYCFMGFWAKNGSVWLKKMAGYPWDCYDYKSTRGAKRWNMTGVWTYILRFQRIFCVERTAESHIGRSCLKYLPAVHLLQMQRPLFDLQLMGPLPCKGIVLSTEISFFILETWHSWYSWRGS